MLLGTIYYSDDTRAVLEYPPPTHTHPRPTAETSSFLGSSVRLAGVKVLKIQLFEYLNLIFRGNVDITY